MNTIWNLRAKSEYLSEEIEDYDMGYFSSYKAADRARATCLSDPMYSDMEYFIKEIEVHD